MTRYLPLLALGGAVALAACDGSGNRAVTGTTPGGDDSGAGGSELSVPRTFSFESVFVPGESSVNYQGQICRQVLITALDNSVRDDNVIGGTEFRSENRDETGDGNVPFFDDTIAGALADIRVQDELGLDLPVPEEVDTLGELCGGKHLDEKFAGNDTVTDHKDWNTEFEGVEGFTSAEEYLRSLLNAVSEQTAMGTQAIGQEHFVSPEGLDYAQLIQKFLLGGVTLSQGMDDYLDDDVENKGLLTPFEQDGEEAFARLEHQWDEGYGYFGAARAYDERSDEVNRTGVVDDNGDGVLDILSEHNFGASTNAAKRDVGASPDAPTDFTGEAFEGLRVGRAIITDAQASFSEMSDEQRQALLAARDQVVTAWEGAIAATVVHYINDTLSAMDAIGTPGFSIADLAKVFSEMKGFALGLQFHRNSPLNQPLESGSQVTRFQRLHELLRDQPTCEASVCTNDQGYRNDLLEARALLGEAYGFAQENLEVW